MGAEEAWKLGGRRGGRRRRVTAAVISAGLAAASLTGALAAGGLVPAALASAAGQGSAVRHARAAGVAVSAGLEPSDWPAYLDGPRHASYSPSQTAITPSTASALVRKWRFTTGAPYLASPTVAAGAVYVGASSGWFYKLSETTGAVLRKTFIGHQRALTCAANGVTSTATVAADPVSHVLTVYVGGGNGYLYALRASDLKTQWRAVVGIPSRKVNNFYDWSSPTVAHDKVYLGVSSSCDHPLIRGGVLAFRQTSGKRIAQFYAVPAGARNAGGSVWSSIGIGPDGDVYATTGNGPAAKPRLGYSESIIRLGPDTLRVLGSFKVPAKQVTRDGDFGASPVFFGRYVGACNKNGIFYVLDRDSMKLAWWKRVATDADGGGACLATPAYNGTDLFLASSSTMIGKKRFRGSVEERRPSSGALIWRTGMQGGVIGSPTLDGGGVLAAGTYSSAPAGVYLINAATGKIMHKLTEGMAFGESVFAGGELFTADSTGVSAWAPPGG